MRTRLFHFLSATSAMLALCCSCVEEIEPSGTLDEPQPLVFTAEHVGGGNGLIPSTRAAADGSWDGGEYVAIQVSSEVKKYKVTSSGGALEPVDGDNTFYRTDTKDIAITAWYPYSASQPSSPDIPTDQSTKAKREAGNLMTASATAVFGETTTLTFSHQAVIVRVKLIGEDGTMPVSTGAAVTILGITALNEGSGYYSVLVLPQNLTTATDLLKVVTSVGTYNATAPAAVTLAAGKSYEYSFNLKRSLVSTGDIVVSLSETKLEYNGSAQTPTVSVSYNGTALIQDTDYTLSWSSSASTAIGSYTVTITGKGAYTGSVEKSYSIVAAPPYVTFTASGDQTFMMTLPTDAEAAAAIGTFEYSVGGGTWTPVTSGNNVPFGGDKGNLRLRGTGLNSADNGSPLGTAEHGGNYSSIKFGTEASVAATGDIRTLISYKNYSTVSTANAKFCYLFKGCTALISAPELPATELAEQCYQGLFTGCTALTEAPALPATNLAGNCYNAMFSGCEDLKTAPALNATNLTESCYFQMFSGCKKLKAAPALPAIVLKRQCYQWMFSGCTSLETAPALPATTLGEYCYQEMFSGCTNLTSAPALPATTLAYQCYYLMFQGCTSLETAPALPATKLANSCYYGMFKGCANLTTVTTLPATTLANSCYKDMFRECTSLTKAPAILATTLAPYCCQQMFYGCKKLKSVTVKATQSSYSTNSSAFRNWLYEVASFGTVYKNADLALPTSSADGIPTGWNSDNGCFYVEAVQAGSTVKMTSNSGPTVNLIYSTDGSTWSTFTVGSTTVTLNNAGDKVYFKAGKMNGTTVSTAINYRFAYSNSNNCNTFSFTGKVNVGGDITTLLTAGGGKSTLSSSNTYAFCKLFYENKNLISAENLLLPSVSLSDHCYYLMFASCEALTAAPDLPATKLAASCYKDMFHYCYALTDIPDELPATTLAESCYCEMFYYCKSLTEAPKLPATTLADYCYFQMFTFCKSLTTAPELPATTLAEYCYFKMFYSCTNLKSVTIKATATATNALSDWLSSRSDKSGTIYYSDDDTYTMLNATKGAIPSGWTAVKK